MAILPYLHGELLTVHQWISNTCTYNVPHNVFVLPSQVGAVPLHSPPFEPFTHSLDLSPPDRANLSLQL